MSTVEQSPPSVPGDSGPARVADVVVLGAGISGLVAASVLLRQGAERIVVVDEYDHVGGNHLDFTHGPFTFDVGSLIFQDDSPLLEHFPQILPRYVGIDPSWSRLNPQGVVTEYPFSVRDDLLAAGPRECLRLAASAVLARTRHRPLDNARDFAEHWLGPRFVHRSGLGHYMERFCGLPAERIDLEFAASRMMWIAEHARVRGLTNRVLGSLSRRPPAPRSNRQLARPVEGYAHLYAPAVAMLREQGVDLALGRRMLRLDRTSEGFLLHTDQGPVRAARVVSTIPVDRAVELCGLRAGLPELPTVTLISLFFSFDGERGFDSSVLYNFDHRGSWKRLTVYSDFYGEREDRQYFGVEVLGDSVGGSRERAEAEFRSHTASAGLLRGDLRLEGDHVLEHAYPLYTEGSGENARASIMTLRRYGVESVGRQGAFQYQPTARHSTLEAERALTPAATEGVVTS